MVSEDPSAADEIPEPSIPDEPAEEAPEPSIRDKPLVELVGAIAGPSSMPGAGSAGTLMLVLAAAYAHKALATTRKVRPLDSAEESAALELTAVIETAFDNADRDSRSCATFLQQRDAERARAVRDSHLLGQEVATRFEDLLRGIQGVIDPVASIDIATAWDLLAVGQRIHAAVAQGNDELTAQVS
jgi:hypothetical protein